MHALAPTILTIIGVTGDLARSKLLPALDELRKRGALPDKYATIGTSRQMGVQIAGVETFPMDVTLATEYERLAKRLREVEVEFGASAERLYYLSVPPDASRLVIEMLGTSGLARVPGTKLLLEKPFGVDASSATELLAHTDRYFAPEEVYLVDHYLAKGVARAIVTAHEQTPPSAKGGLVRIEIGAGESIGIERRARFYEQTGALRDVLQSHLLQLAALTLLPPSRGDAEGMPARRLAALQGLRLSESVPAHRGQYVGYREEVGNPSSMVETYADVTLLSDDPRYTNVPITLVTGKKMEKKETTIRLWYRTDAGEEREVAYIDTPERVTDAYERILLAAMRGERDLFVSGAEVLESWRIIAPVQAAWEQSGSLFFYEPGRPLWGRAG